jgi:ABC-type antimicrobial peptide transport system permease subunit
MAPGSLTGSTFIETLLLGGAATVVAAFTSQLAVLTFTWSSEVLTGLAIPYRPAVGGLLVAAVSAVAVALVGAAIPAWRVGRADPITALREA